MKYLITGGAGFIGSHLAERLLRRGDLVVILDNFSRQGSRSTAMWLHEQFSRRLELVEADVAQDIEVVGEQVAKCDAVFHLAAQVAVTTSVIDPQLDFNTNALGTFNVLEALRTKSPHTPLIYSSTNKVYGALSNLRMEERANRYIWPDHRIGINETQGLDLHSPYGCSKGAADQYVLDYARIFGLDTTVFRQSCIYGPRQFGIEDQGWLAWFAIAGFRGIPVTLYGTGKQVRDLLFVSDLLDLFELALSQSKHAKGTVYNVGGGFENTLSLLESIPLIEDAIEKRIDLHFSDMRPGDQHIYISDVSKASSTFGWSPKISTGDGIALMSEWIVENLETLSNS